MKKHRIIIAGGRDFEKQAFVNSKLDHIFRNLNQDDIEIVEGGARGADRCGRVYAETNGIDYVTFNADWENLGRKAGPIRNSQMAEYANKLVAFWDGKSRGTENMIDTANKLGLKVVVVRYE